MLRGGLLPFPRTGCVLYAKAILSYCSQIRQVHPRERTGRVRRVARQPYCTFGENLADNRGGVTSAVNLNRWPAARVSVRTTSSLCTCRSHPSSSPLPERLST
jgi:hypothetical protein